MNLIYTYKETIIDKYNIPEEALHILNRDLRAFDQLGLKQYRKINLKEIHQQILSDLIEPNLYKFEEMNGHL